MEELTGCIDHIIYSNQDNGYTVFVIISGTEEITCVGSLHAVSPGENLKLKGEWTKHPIYGEQFKFESYEVVEPTDIEAIARYLGSGAVKGVGAALAGRIVDMFGEDTFRVLAEEPELLSRVKGISARKAQEIAAAVIEKQDLRKVMLFMQKYGISNSLAMKIYGFYGPDTYSVLEENPYRMAEDIEGIGFKIADEIAAKVGIHVDSDFRIRSGIVYTLSSAVADGHAYLPMEELKERAAELLSVNPENVELQIENLSMDRKIIIRTVGDEIRVWGKRLYYMELDCARKLADLNVPILNDNEALIDTLTAIAKREDIEADEIQLLAAANAVKYGISIITGGPGTGKTTTINLILKYFEYENADVCLAAPTGRAAKRMTETTGYEASTIQRMLGLGRNADSASGYGYDRNEDNPLEADVIVIDEMSMVDLPLMNALLRAIIPGTRLILVGDVNQLPSVGPGSVLRDIIESGCFKTVCLKKIYRQDEESDIIVNAHKVNSGEVPDIRKKSRDFFFLEREDVNVLLKHMVLLISEKLPKYVDARPFDIQVLTPMRKGSLGVESLNPILQKHLNPGKPGKKECTAFGVTFREGDKVMQIRNNYQLEWEVRGKYGIVYDKGLGVFNGDMGVITTINDFSETVEVAYEENHTVVYPYSMLEELELAYAVTIHKSQGSEYPAVVIPLMSGPKMLLTRNLLYTALTRARKTVVILGRNDVFEEMIANGDVRKRYTGLKEAICDMYSEENEN